MRILFVVPYTPSLIRVRPYQLIRALVRRGHQVTVVTLWSSESELPFLEELRRLGVQVAHHYLPGWRSILNCSCALPTGIPLQAAHSWHPEMARTIRRALHEQEFDVIHVEHLRGARFGLEARRWRQRAREQSFGNGNLTPVVWDSVDCITHLFDQAKSLSSDRKKRWMTGFEVSRTRSYEPWLTEQFDHVLVTSRRDREELIKLSRRRRSIEQVEKGECQPWISVLPNGVDLEYFVPGCETRDEFTLVFSGKMSYHANVTAVLYLANHVMPLVWEKRADVCLKVVGKDPPRELRKLARSSRVGKDKLLISGTVSDIRPYLWEAALAVVPLPYGAGIQNKVLEAMACGTPVITSPKAAAALKAQPGEDLVVAEGPESLARSIVDLLNRPDRRKALSLAGRRYVEVHHNWNEIAGRLECLYKDTIDQLNKAWDQVVDRASHCE